MKQYNYELTSVPEVKNTLIELYKEVSNYTYSSILFHLYTYKFNNEQIIKTQKEILYYFPDASIAGTSSNGDICDGHLAEDGMVMSVSVFEMSSTSTHLFKCNLGEEASVGNRICELIDSAEGITAAEIFITLKTINSHRILNAIEKCHKDIVFFGGGSAGLNISDNNTRIINENTITEFGVLIVIYKGPDLHIDVHHAIGWKALGRDLTVTRIDGKRLYEIDNVPAGSLYSKYLDINADDDFFSNILEFPIMSHQHGYEVLRLPFECYKEDQSIFLAADIDKGTPIHLSYGDPEVIRSDVKKLERTVKKFAPQAIFLYSCGVRKLYWKYLINKETGPFSNIAPVAGFYSSGEIMRMGDYIIEHHVTLIAISMREGGKAKAAPTGDGDKAMPMTEEQKMHSQISMVRRLANFINVTSSELMEANEKLQEIADTDELTGLYNRRMLNKLMASAVIKAEKYKIEMIVGIIDIDDFKQINDTYGHATGDYVLHSLTQIMSKEIELLPSVIFGRWGGEEFLFFIPQWNLDEVVDGIEEARKRVSSTEIKDVGRVTISVGLTKYKKGDTVDSLFERADAALYEAKETGKNKSCIKY